MMVGREVRLARRPIGWPEPSDFEVVDAVIPRAEKGQLLVQNLIMSVDPYMRNRMNAVRSYVPAYKVGQALEGGAIGRVIYSEADHVQPGVLVIHDLGWRDYAVVEADQVTPIRDSCSEKGVYLGVLGMPGLTAYAGMVNVASVQPGETVFVSSAAGGVGLVAGQVAKLRGAGKVIGSTGNPGKAKLLASAFGFDATINYHDGPIDTQLRRAAPEGIDVYLDNVGGDHLEAAIAMMNPHGRIAACGMISRYNSTDLDNGPRNIMQVIAKRITLRGYIIDDYVSERDANLRQLARWVSDGRLKHHEAIVEGLDNASCALLDLMRGKHFGKVLVKIAD
jgi:hypothetical protein